MHDRSDIASRMKGYEKVTDYRLVNRSVTICRIDGRAFHTLTRGFVKPFDLVLTQSMQNTMKYLCQNIQGCVLGYHQSDEISLAIIDYENLDTTPWFDNRIQKICSITASMATLAFNRAFQDNIAAAMNAHSISDELSTIYTKALMKGAMFDCRAFNLPKEEVCNYFYWRQLDATRNSIEMVGQAHFSHKELMNKSCNDIQNMLLTQKDINWNNYPEYLKRGSCCIKTDQRVQNPDKPGEYVTRQVWVIDRIIPVFKGDDRKYINDTILFEE